MLLQGWLSQWLLLLLHPSLWEVLFLVDCPDLVAAHAPGQWETLQSRRRSSRTPPEFGLHEHSDFLGGRLALSLSSHPGVAAICSLQLNVFPSCWKGTLCNLFSPGLSIRFPMASPLRRIWWEPSLVTHAFNFSTREAGVWGQPAYVVRACLLKGWSMGEWGRQQKDKLLSALHYFQVHKNVCPTNYRMFLTVRDGWNPGTLPVPGHAPPHWLSQRHLLVGFAFLRQGSIQPKMVSNSLCTNRYRALELQAWATSLV